MIASSRTTPDLSSATIEQKIATYLDARRKAVDFILRHTNDDGSIGPVEKGMYYHRMPWTLALAGETRPALRLTHWIRQNMFTAEGDFRGARSPFDEDEADAFTYSLSCLVYGAQILRQFDIAYRGVDFMLRWQDPVSGGFYMNRQRTGAPGRQQLFATAQAGMSCVITHRIDAAIKVGQWFERLWKLQPELPDRLYTVYSTAEGLVTGGFAEDNRRNFVNEAQEPHQYHYNGGIAAAFLCQLYGANGDRTWLDLAREYQAFSMNSTERQFEVMQVCKSGWGGALLYLATGEAQYRDWAIKLGDWFVSHQFADGHWENSAYLFPATLTSNLGITAEFTVHMDTIAGALSARQAR